MKGNFDAVLHGACWRGPRWLAALFGLGASGAGQGMDEPFREPYLKALRARSLPICRWR